jgi:hypothetical protein
MSPTATDVRVHYGPGAAPLPPNDPDALAILAAARGKTAADDARACVRFIDDSIRDRLVTLDLGRAHEVIEVLPDMLARRAAYASRHATLLKAVGLPPDPIDEPLDIPDLVHISACVKLRSYDIHGVIGLNLAHAKTELARVEKRIDDWKAIAQSDERFALEVTSSHPGHDRRLLVRPSDAWLEVASPLCEERRQWAARVKQGERDLKRAHDLVAASVMAAVESAGRIDQVADQVVAALALAAIAPSAAVKALEAQAHGVKATLAKLEADGVSDNPIASEARAKLDTLAESIENARKSEASARRSTAQMLVSRALTGDEKSRAELEWIATSSPGAFPNGFSSAIAGSRFDRAALKAIQEQLAAA